MSRIEFWTQRLAEVTMDASLTNNPEHRLLYLDLAEHYSLMARICAKKPLISREGEEGRF